MFADLGNGDDVPLCDWHAAARAAGTWRRRAHRLLCWSTAIGAAALPVSMPLGTAALGVGLFAALLCRAPLQRAPGFALGVIFSVWCLVSVAVTYGGGSLRLSLVYSWLAFAVGYVVYHDRTTRLLALRLLAASLSAAALLALAQFTVGLDPASKPLRLSPDGQRHAMAYGFLGYHLTYGAVAALVLPVFLAEGRRGIVGGVAGALGALLSVARLAYLGAVAGTVAYATLAAVRRGRALALALVVGLTACGAMAFLAPDKARAVLEMRDGRFAIWEVTFAIIDDHPILGVGGRSNFERDYVARWPEVVGWRPDLPFSEPKMAHPHNSFLSITANHGLPALGLYLLLLFGFVHAARRAGARHRQAGAAAAAVLVTFVVAGQFNDLAAQSETGYAFFIALALALTGRRVCES